MGLVGQVPNVQSVRFRFKKLKFQIQSARCIPIYLDFFGARSHGTSLSLSLSDWKLWSMYKESKDFRGERLLGGF